MKRRESSQLIFEDLLNFNSNKSKEKGVLIT